MTDLRMSLLAMCLLLSPAFAKTTCQAEHRGQAGQQGKRPRRPRPTNLKVLKAYSGDEVIQIMHTFTAALGRQCA